MPLGGNAVGTGINIHPDFAARAARLSELTVLPVRETPTTSRPRHDRHGVAATAPCGRSRSLPKIANDIR